MSDQTEENEDMTYWTKSEIFGLMKSPIHKTNKLREEFQDLADDQQDIKLKNMAKQNIVLSKKMIKNYEKKIINGGFAKMMSEEIENEKLLEEAERLKALGTNTVIEEANEAQSELSGQ